MPHLEHALRSLTTDQPLQPADRLGTVRRRARRIRRTRAVVAGTAALAVLGTGGALLQQRQAEATRFTHRVVTQWPDRSSAQDRGVADGAVDAYRRDVELESGSVQGRPRWLFRGTVPLPDHDDTYLAVYVIRHDGRDVVVTSQAGRREVDSKGLDRASDGSSSAWVAHEVPLTRDLDQVGAYLGYTGDEPVTDPETGVTTGDQRTELFVLADPASRKLRWTEHPVPFAAAGTGRERTVGGTLTSTDGLFVGDAGALLGPVTVDLVDRHGNVRAAGALRGGSVGLASPSTPQVPAGWAQRFSASGTAERQADGSWSAGPGFADFGDYPRKVAAVQVRCYGGGALLLTMRPNDSETVLAEGRVACDGRSHEALRHLAPAHGFAMQLSGADRLIAVSYVGGTVG